VDIQSISALEVLCSHALQIDIYLLTYSLRVQVTAVALVVIAELQRCSVVSVMTKARFVPNRTISCAVKTLVLHLCFFVYFVLKIGPTVSNI